jgi:hypothetical protein
MSQPNDGDFEHICTIKMIDDTKSKQFLHYINVLMMIMNHYNGFPKVK